MSDYGYRTKDSSTTVSTATACGAFLAVGLGVTSPAYTASVTEFEKQKTHELDCQVTEESYSYTLSSVKRMSENLAALHNRYCINNWNGYNESQISVNSWNYAREFVKSLPTWVSEAEVMIDADGEISFEWYRNKTEYLELVFGASGCVHLFMKTKNAKRSDLFKDNCRDKLIPLIAEFENV